MSYDYEGELLDCHALIEELEDKVEALGDDTKYTMIKHILKEGCNRPFAGALLALLEREVIWCQQNPDEAFSPDYRKGFIDGLIQARRLVTKASAQAIQK